MKKLFVYIFCAILLLFNFSPATGQAKSTSLTLSTKDLTFLDVTPNEAVTKSMNRMVKRYPKLEFSESEGDYYTGDPTQNMNYFLKFYTDNKKRTVGVLYEQFNEKRPGMKFGTSKGIKIGSTMQTVREKYGKNNYTEKTSSDPRYNYVDFTYPIVLKETKQKGTLTFTMRYLVGSKKSSATVYGVEYKVETLKEQASPRLLSEMTLAQLKVELNKALKKVGEPARIKDFKKVNMEDYGLSGTVYEYNFTSSISIIVGIENNKVASLGIMEGGNKLYPSTKVKNIQAAAIIATNKITDYQKIQQELARSMQLIKTGQKGMIIADGLSYNLLIQTIPELPLLSYTFMIAK
ncbi:hypothetical protein SAMN05880501_11681 [Ureibacillus xyleni]|uniref:Uncharacterized protein n=1 Tax=Ureibacillus xyleni TaxID=614648 RepID=A0A285TPF5_9BACL|nr:hypothetical protein [Ureibacillus xyleni]SOC24046.1 hypothetical protein SAMN05880501_11681 [Ureibacillus xyleni]